MEFNLSKFKSCLLLSLSMLAFSSYAASPMFTTSFTKEGGEGNGYLVVRTNIPNHTYSNAGIQLKGSNYVLSDNADCAVNPKNGWCLFSGDNQISHAFKVTKVKDSGTSLSQISFALALSAVSKPISIQDITLLTDGSSGVTSGRMIGYVAGFDGAPTAASIAAAHYTHVLIAFGVFSTSNPGEINLDGIDQIPDLKSYITDLKAQGMKVLLSIGGAYTPVTDTTIDFDAALLAAQSAGMTPGQFEAAMVHSMTSLVNTYGFDGFDIDIESGLYPPTPGTSSQFTDPNRGCDARVYDQGCGISYLASVINGFKRSHPERLITLAPQIDNIGASARFDNIWANYSGLIMQTHAALEWVGIQMYNSGCAYGINGICYPVGGELSPPGAVSEAMNDSPDPAVVFATGLLENWPVDTPNGFLPYISYLKPSQVVIGYAVNNGAGTSDGVPAVNLTVAQQVIQCLRTGTSCDTYTPANIYPDIGGMFDWTINYDATNSYNSTLMYQFSRTLYPCIVQGNCTT